MLLLVFQDVSRNESLAFTERIFPTNQGSTWAGPVNPQGSTPEVFHIVLQEAPCSVLQLLNLRRYWRPRLVAQLTLPLLCLGMLSLGVDDLHLFTYLING